MTKNYINRFSLIIILVLFLIVFFNFFFLSEVTKELFVNIDKSWNEDEYDRICQWISIDRDYFFKRTSTFFFNDANLLTFTYLTHSKSSLQLLFTFNIYLNDDRLITKEISNLTRSVGKRKNYGISYIYYRFDNQTYFQIKDKIKKFEIKIKDLNTKKATKEFIQVRIKNIFSKDKKGVFYCSKCMYNTKLDDFESIKWWIEMKKKVGYTKIGFCNNSIENHEKYTKLFEDHRDFVELDQFNCLPNFYDQSSKYFLSFPEFSKLNNGLAYHIFNSVYIFYMNECYWSNIDKYRYVSIMDRDEIIFPKKLKLKTDSDIIDYVVNLNDVTMEKIFQDLDCKYDENNMENYLDKLTVQTKKRTNSSFYFKNGIKFPNELFQVMFDSMELYFNSSNRKSEDKHKIDIFYDQINNKKFTITISSVAEFNYAIKLLELNKKAIKPYFKSFNQKLHIKKYNSFYTITGSSVHWVVGKTTHNTNRSLATEIHFNTKQIDYSTLNIVQGRDVTYVNHNLAYLSHFKNGLRMKPIPISQFLPDLNYIICYFRPTVKNF